MSQKPLRPRHWIGLPPVLLALLFWAGLAGPAAGQPTATEAIPDRPERSDRASERLIDNFLTASGGKQNHIDARVLMAEGTIEEAGRTRNFRLLETQDGRRLLTLYWTHLGRAYEEVYAFDGASLWQQKRLPEEEPPEDWTGRDAEHFRHQRWLVRPFIVPLKAAYTFDYQGSSRAAGRPAHLIVGYGPGNERSWFYFDKENFLVTRWGGLGRIGGVDEYLDYAATAFAATGGVLYPSRIEMLAEDDAFGSIEIENLEVNPAIDLNDFYRPPDDLPMLRQIPLPAE